MPWPDKNPAGLDASEKTSFGKGVFRMCDGCGETVTAERLVHNHEVCPQCGKHHKLGAPGWRKLILDDGALDEWDAHLEPSDPLTYRGRSRTARTTRASSRSQSAPMLPSRSGSPTRSTSSSVRASITRCRLAASVTTSSSTGTATTSRSEEVKGSLFSLQAWLGVGGYL